MNFIEIMKNLIADVASSKLKSMKKMKIKERAEKEREREEESKEICQRAIHSRRVTALEGKIFKGYRPGFI